MNTIKLMQDYGLTAGEAKCVEALIYIKQHRTLTRADYWPYDHNKLIAAVTGK